MADSQRKTKLLLLVCERALWVLFWFRSTQMIWCGNFDENRREINFCHRWLTGHNSHFTSPRHWKAALKPSSSQWRTASSTRAKDDRRRLTSLRVGNLTASKGIHTRPNSMASRSLNMWHWAPFRHWTGFVVWPGAEICFPFLQSGSCGFFSYARVETGCQVSVVWYWGSDTHAR